MPHYKLTYLNGKGRAELVRLIFAAANVKFEDVRIEIKDWPVEKQKFRFLQVPILDIDGVQLNQTIAIAQYLAREFHLAGKTNLEDAQCLALAEQVKDLLDVAFDFRFRERDATRKAEKKQAFENGALKTMLPALEAHFKENVSKAGYVVGSSLTWADLAVYNILELVQHYLDRKDDFLAPYPTLAAHSTFIRSLPRIKKYLESHPGCPETAWMK